MTWAARHAYSLRMPKRSSKDENEIAAAIVAQVTQEADEQPGKNPAAVALGRLGGKKGGPARARALSASKRRAIAKTAGAARWKKS